MTVYSGHFKSVVNGNREMQPNKLVAMCTNIGYIESVLASIIFLRIDISALGVSNNYMEHMHGHSLLMTRAGKVCSIS